MVGTERRPGPLSRPCTFKLWDATETRVVTLGNITFPEGPDGSSLTSICGGHR